MAKRLVVTVAHSGVGIPAQRTAGVGLQSMRERVAEIGGTLHIDTPETAGR